MSESEFIAAIEECGGSDVWIMRAAMDHGAKRGVAVSYVKGGKLNRSGVRFAADEDEALAFEALLEWARD